MHWIVDSCPPPEIGQHGKKRRIGEGKTDGCLAQGVMSKDGHSGHRAHLQKREQPGADIVVAVEIMVQRSIQPSPPYDYEEEDEPAQSGQIRMASQNVGHLGNEHDVD